MANRTCSIDGCDGKVVGRGWCSKHWQRWRRLGDPEAGVLPRFPTPASRLAAMQVTTPGGCVLYTGRKNESGYGMIRSGGSMQLVHRVAWEIEHGPIPDGLTLDHMCHTRACFNLAHLRLATRRQNSENHSGRPHWPNTISGVRGVTWYAGKWVARVSQSGRTAYYEAFDDLDEAAEAVKRARLQLHTYNDADRRECKAAAAGLHPTMVEH